MPTAATPTSGTPASSFAWADKLKFRSPEQAGVVERDRSPFPVGIITKGAAIATRFTVGRPSQPRITEKSRIRGLVG